MININYKRLALSLMLLLLVIGGTVKLSQALFQDEEVSSHTVSLGTLNLQVGDSDPIDLPINTENMASSQNDMYTLQLKNTGSLPGNFWIQPVVDNSSEGQNTEAEGDVDTANGGEAEECVHILMNVLDAAGNDHVLYNGSLSGLDTSYDQDSQTAIDDIVNAGDGQMQIRLTTGNCGSEAIGDEVDLMLDFNLEQIQV
jgi:hypothetical protein